MKIEFIMLSVFFGLDFVATVAGMVQARWVYFKYEKVVLINQERYVDTIRLLEKRIKHYINELNEAKKPNTAKHPPLHCAFCGKGNTEVKKLIAGPNVYICDECVELSADIVRDEVNIRCEGLNGN
jgi:hypothetical protein